VGARACLPVVPGYLVIGAALGVVARVMAWPRQRVAVGAALIMPLSWAVIVAALIAATAGTLIEGRA